MAASMTGFGRATASADGRELTIELKSVNHRYLDISFRMPRSVSFLEEALRARLGELLSRGHVDVFADYKNNRSDAGAVAIDEALLGAYLAAARQAGEKYALLDDITLSAAMRLPDVFDVKKAEEDRDAVTALALAALEGAASQLRLARAQEGARLAKDLLGRLDTLEGIAAVVALRAPKVVEDYRARLDERISAVLAGVEVDRQRLATEVALFADKASIDEELVRLKSHIAQMRGLLRGDEAVGRRLDFVVQELNREFNTIGSKANDAEISEKVIFGKAEIEKIREQVQNIE
ncbi:MAG: hypothetical protein BWY35_01118 [Firmicutes bacterium ADurb.Bin248]|nr:MAG: hypothetical protein BWY35_01118 [Firmicutes bacterium ADurb.Bin248]HOG01105.1 YicC family protein [Clostridia bacterium]HPK15685.1 YicC family protein [Clostridia bacterium]